MNKFINNVFAFYCADTENSEIISKNNMFRNKKKVKNIDNQIQSEQTNISRQKKQNLYTNIYICISILSRLFVISCLLVLILLLLSQFNK